MGPTNQRTDGPVILVVDDDEGIRSLLSALLLSLDCEPLVAASAREARAVLASTPVTGVLSDFAMPGASGLDLLRHVRAEWPDVNFVLMSSLFPDGVVEAGRLAGADAVVDKAALVERLPQVAAELAHPRPALSFLPDPGNSDLKGRPPMTSSFKRTLAIGTAAAVGIAGGTAAIASATDGSHGNRSALALVKGGHGDELSAAAAYLGLTVAQLQTALQSGKTLAQVADATSGKSAAGLIDALVAAETTELAAAVTAGKLTQAQADAKKANLKQHVTAEVNATFRANGHGKGFGHGRGGVDLGAAVTAYLGKTAAQLQTDLQSGKTLAQIADATPNKSAAGLIDALVAAETTQLAAQVTAGKLTQAQADAIKTTLKQRVTALVNSVGAGKADHGFGHRGGGGDLTAAASYLGKTAAQLQTDLQSGKTLGQIADATSNKSAAGLIDALVAAETTKLNAAVAAGRLTQAQADAMKANLKQRVTARVNRTKIEHGFRHR
jgi:CheY-like chemotaxis protein